MSSTKSTPPLKHGEEPTSLLLALAWSPIETLLARGEARIFIGAGEVAIIFTNTVRTEEGIVLATVGKTEGAK